jgi:hypothetical protein
LAVVGCARIAADKTLADLARNFRRSCPNGVSMKTRLRGVNIMADDKEVLDWVSPRRQREIDNQAAFLRFLLEREEAIAQEGEKLYG